VNLSDRDLERLLAQAVRLLGVEREDLERRLRLGHDEHATLRRWDIAAIALEFVVLGMFFVELAANGGQRGRAAASLFFGGGYTAVFWAMVVITGLAMPLALELVEARRQLRPSVLAPALLLIGGLSLRWIFVLAGQASL